jgi:hypothetical protein
MDDLVSKRSARSERSFDLGQTRRVERIRYGKKSRTRIGPLEQVVVDRIHVAG